MRQKVLQSATITPVAPKPCIDGLLPGCVGSSRRQTLKAGTLGNCLQRQTAGDCAVSACWRTPQVCVRVFMANKLFRPFRG